MSKVTDLKFYAGQTVFWLSPKGFAKGIVKRISYSEEMIPTDQLKLSFRRSIQVSYYLWSESNSPDYQGDIIRDADLIFTNYKAMLSYYQKTEPK
jgi:hypothetical protein